jgi:hypothetical protein
LLGVAQLVLLAPPAVLAVLMRRDGQAGEVVKVRPQASGEQQLRMLREHGFQLAKTPELDELDQQGLEFPDVARYRSGPSASLFRLLRHTLSSLAVGSTY